jgi:uncharacterized protein
MDNGADIYTIPFDDKFVMYRPRRHVAFVGNDALSRYVLSRARGDDANVDEEIETFLEAVGFDRPQLDCDLPELPPDIRPTSAVLMMTNRCNLRCTYCYANAGEEPRPAEMTWPITRSVIDFVAHNASETGNEPPSLTFHGGGEPTMHWDLLVRAVEYARSLNPDTRVSMSSNGVWSEDQRRFICEHFTDVSLSMDGLVEVQDSQRPRPDGGPSATSVWENIRALDEAGIDYGVRMTVLPESVEQLTDGVRLICRDSQARAIQVEPTFTSGRGQYGDIELSFADAFCEQFMAAWRVGREAERQVYYSGARPWVISSMFCMAPLKAAVATADGRLVTCFEVFSETSPLAKGFTVGRVHDGRVEYDRAALQAFLDAQLERRRECSDCFCYWHCCGDCATRRPGPREAGSGRCHATRKITLELLLAYMAEGEGIWMGLREEPAGCL